MTIGSVAEIEAALRYVENLDQFQPKERVLWLEFRQKIERWCGRQGHSALDDAYQAVADMPQELPDEADRWEELRHQAILVAG
ncbi:MAG: hypothetical protein AAFP79_04895 [Pseudomonadota bacterium]